MASARSPVANQLDDAIIDQTEGHIAPAREAHHHHQASLDFRRLAHGTEKIVILLQFDLLSQTSDCRELLLEMAESTLE